MSAHFDTLETRPHATREAALMAALPLHIAHAQHHSAAYASLLAGINAASINSRQALSTLPVVRKHELLDRQKAGRAATALQRDPFGGFSTVGWKGLLRQAGAKRVYQSPGPIYEPEGHATH